MTDPYAGVATTLVELGVPAVVAMQFEISDEAAIVFAEELYMNLIGRQDPIDAAVAEARKAVYSEVDEIEWATPVLFLRDPDVQLFDFAAGGAAAPAAGPPLGHRRARRARRRRCDPCRRRRRRRTRARRRRPSPRLVGGGGRRAPCCHAPCDERRRRRGRPPADDVAVASPARPHSGF